MSAPERLESRWLLSNLPTGFTEATVATGLQSPTAMEVAPDGRIFVCEQGGALRVIKNDILLPTPFVDLNVDDSGERGLLGIAFDPDFATNQFVYVYYTVNTTPKHNRVSRFTADGDVALAGSEQVILELPNLSGATNHNGGAIHFGPDGKLYIAVGDNANGANSQSMTTLLGKMLRINKDGTIPSDNPFFNTVTGNNRAIWAKGLRNPFTFAFQPGSARMFLNDVGQDTWEEINDGIAGSNYGWPNNEGPTNAAGVRSPLFAYNHGGDDPDETGCAIAGGAFYNPAAATFPSDLVGDYFFADFCNGWIRKFDPVASAVVGFATEVPAFPVDLKVEDNGNLLLLSLGEGSVTRISFDSDAPPSITRQPANQIVTEGRSATFSVQASGQGPLTFQWQRDEVDIDGATSATLTLNDVALSDSGAEMRCVVTNENGSTPSQPATLTVTADLPPAARIALPTSGSFYQAGDVLTFAGGGTDPEDGTLTPDQLTWKIEFHHDDHAHPFFPLTSGISGGQVPIPTLGETSTDVFYRVTLTVTDSRGHSVTMTRDVLPRVAMVTLDSNAVLESLTLDEQPFARGGTFTGVVGATRSIGATEDVLFPPDQLTPYSGLKFVRWSDGRSASHDITISEGSATLFATYRLLGGPTVWFNYDTRTLTLQPVGGVSMSVSASSGNVVVKINGVTQPILDPVPAASVCRIVFLGSDGADKFDASSVTASRFPNLIGVFADGGLGNDSLLGSSFADSMFGGEGNDSLIGNSGKDLLKGEAGLDRLFGGNGNDQLDGGGDNDSIRGDDGNDTLTGGTGHDTLSGGDDADRLVESGDVDFTLTSSRLTGLGTDSLSNIETARLIGGDDANQITTTPFRGSVTLIGGGGNDSLISAGSADLLQGGDGSDSLSAGAGDDSLQGGAGNDELIGGSGNDSLDGDSGDDFLRGNSGNDTLQGFIGDDLLNGGSGRDQLFGGDGDDGLAGASGNDKLEGGHGRDTLVGGADKDTLLGGTGNDQLAGESGNDSLAGHEGSDTLAGGAGTDQIDGLSAEIDESFTFFADWVAAV